MPKVKIEIAREVPGYDPPGTIVEVDHFRAERWIKSGLARPLQPTKPKAAAPPPPSKTDDPPSKTDKPSK